MYKLKKDRIALVGAVVILIVGTFLFINNSSSKGTASEVPPTVSSEEMENFLYGDNGIVNHVHNELSEKGYIYRLLIAAYSKEDIQMKIILLNKEATELEQEEIKSIFYELVKKSNLNPKAFTLKVSDSDDGPDW
ncbi:hypothetical protein [Solibacillus ferritrahens]|uniref:hypothetical protein n=1 Tax=Solibacillus ferritrahens TaxID=3098620 RepID=UPI00300A1EBA